MFTLLVVRKMRSMCLESELTLLLALINLPLAVYIRYLRQNGLSIISEESISILIHLL